MEFNGQEFHWDFTEIEAVVSLNGRNQEGAGLPLPLATGPQKNGISGLTPCGPAIEIPLLTASKPDEFDHHGAC